MPASLLGKAGLRGVPNEEGISKRLRETGGCHARKAITSVWEAEVDLVGGQGKAGSLRQAL